MGRSSRSGGNYGGNPNFRGPSTRSHSFPSPYNDPFSPSWTPQRPPSYSGPSRSPEEQRRRQQEAADREFAERLATEGGDASSDIPTFANVIRNLFEAPREPPSGRSHRNSTPVASTSAGGRNNSSSAPQQFTSDFGTEQDVENLMNETRENMQRVEERPADPKDIKKLKTVRLTAIQLGKVKMMADKCTICQEEWRLDQEVTLLNCAHAFCKECLVPWLQRCDRCPNWYFLNFLIALVSQQVN
ncbi:hypothetical protein BT69DRAFT_985231 [Atractiella rhizophila]|nr:hypothetical protein BT69DRAFT_985231 [Atractiella rhizophila]